MRAVDVTKDAPANSAELPEREVPEQTTSAAERAPAARRRHKRNFLLAPVDFARDVKLEMKKVTWPNRQEVSSTTVVVVIAVAFFGLYLWGVDSLLAFLFTKAESWLR
jgi:preprotein translocase subunit SecE